MRRLSVHVVLLILCNLFLFSRFPAASQQSFANSSIAKPDCRNFYGIAWRGTGHDNLAFAKQMGYEYVFYQYGMEHDSLSNGLYFYLETPEHFLYNSIIDTKKAYSANEISFYETHCSLKTFGNSFPYNLATGWRWLPDTTKFTVLLDYQQQKVVSWAIDSILRYAAAIERRNPKFHFGGYAWDEPRPSGDFWDAANGKLHPASLKTWDAEDRAFTPPGIVRQYSTYTDGHMEFYKQLFKATRYKYPNARFMSEPYHIYEDWIKLVKDRTDAKEITPDILSQEGPGTAFVDDNRIYASGLVAKKNVYCTTPNVFDEENNRILMAKAAINGAGFGWYGRFGGTGNMPNYQNITDVPARLKLIRILAIWENRNGTALSERQWNGSIYQSKSAFASADVISALQPHTNKLFVVFLTSRGVVKVPDGKRIASVSKTNDLFVENGNGATDIIIAGNTIQPKDTSLGKGYIFLLH